jgi:ferredoxin-NADP reductase
MGLDLAGRVLRSRAAAALASPHGVDRYLEMLNPMWAAQEVRARVVDVRREVDVPGHPIVSTLTLQPTSTWRGHRAGQHVQVGVEVDGGRRATRVFTVSSPDSRPGDRFTLTVRANPDTEGRAGVSSFLAERARPGVVLHLSQAQGDFVLPDRVPEHVLLVSGGSGITPVMSMLRSLQRRTHRGRVTFLHYSPGPERQIFAAELDEVRRGGHGIDLHVLHPRLGDPYLSPAYLERLVPGYRDVDAWVCGPERLIAAARAAYGLPGAPGDPAEPREAPRLRVEYFRAPRAATGSSGGDLTFARTGRTVANTGDTLLAQAEAAGLRPESGCRMGICFSCTATKRDGTVRNILTGETSSRPDEDVRLCVSTPEGDCSVDL